MTGFNPNRLSGKIKKKKKKKYKILTEVYIENTDLVFGISIQARIKQLSVEHLPVTLKYTWALGFTPRSFPAFADPLVWLSYYLFYPVEITPLINESQTGRIRP